MIQILLIEDDAALVELIRASLPQLGFPAQLEVRTDGVSGLAAAVEDRFSLILLDISLPQLDGFSVCEQIRDRKIYTPLVILTGKDQESERVRGLELGADDYLVKPIGIPELTARIRALLRRSKIDPLSESRRIEPELVAVGPLRLDVSSRRTWLHDEEISLSRSEFELLFMLMSKPGTVFSRQTLLEEIWGYNSESYSHVLNPHITRLRKKIEEDPAKPVLLLTDWGKGYRFATIEELEPNDDQ